jgi:sec-independent protein translocase protein TatA
MTVTAPDMAPKIKRGEKIMLGKLGMPEMLVLLTIALLIFGPRKLGELGKGLGDGIRGFKSALQEDGAKEQAK